MKQRNTIPLPTKMQDLPVDVRGFPIPYIIWRDQAGKPHFKINDDYRVEVAISNDLCAICGKKMNNDKWLIGGPDSAFHPNGAYIDTPNHHECGQYALQVCPYLAFIGYHSKLNFDKLPEGIFVDPTVDPNRVPFFVFIKISDFTVIRPTPVQRYLKPVKPYLGIEYWNNGEKITEQFAQELYKRKQ